jgi:hypothetical protein
LQGGWTGARFPDRNVDPHHRNSGEDFRGGFAGVYIQRLARPQAGGGVFGQCLQPADGRPHRWRGAARHRSGSASAGATAPKEEFPGRHGTIRACPCPGGAKGLGREVEDTLKGVIQ